MNATNLKKNSKKQEKCDDQAQLNGTWRKEQKAEIEYSYYRQIFSKGKSCGLIKACNVDSGQRSKVVQYMVSAGLQAGYECAGVK